MDCVALDAALLEKLQAVAEHLREAEGWEWCAGRMEPVGSCREDAGTYRSLPEPEAVLTEAEEERLNELMAVTTRWKTSVRNPTCWKQK